MSISNESWELIKSKVFVHFIPSNDVLKEIVLESDEGIYKFANKEDFMNLYKSKIDKFKNTKILFTFNDEKVRKEADAYLKSLLEKVFVQ